MAIGQDHKFKAKLYKKYIPNLTIISPHLCNLNYISSASDYNLGWLNSSLTTLLPATMTRTMKTIMTMTIITTINIMTKKSTAMKMILVLIDSIIVGYYSPNSFSCLLLLQLQNPVVLLVLATQCTNHTLLPDESLCHKFSIDNHL